MRGPAPEREAQDREIIALRRDGLSCKEVASRLGIGEHRVWACMRRHGLQRKYHTAGRAARATKRPRVKERSPSYVAIPNTQPRGRSSRFTLVRDIEHHCRCYVNAFVSELQGVRSQEAPEQRWRILCQVLLTVLTSEGMVEKVRGHQEPLE